jgi:vacuolar-type H+-ATPase subunit E/Vma4
LSAQALLENLRAAARGQIEQIEENGRQRAERIVSAARAEAEAQKERILSDGRAKLNRTQALIEQRAIIRALQIHADARQSLIEEALQKARNSFDALRARQDYPAIFEMLVIEALDALRPSLLPGQHAILRVDPRDMDLCQTVIENLAQLPEVRADLQCYGGCETETEDGLVTVRNTINARFERAQPAVRQELGVFFEERAAG